MDDLVRSKEKSSPEKEERQEVFDLEKESAKFKKKRATRAQVEAETSLKEETADPVEGGIDKNPSVSYFSLSISTEIWMPMFMKQG